MMISIYQTVVKRRKDKTKEKLEKETQKKWKFEPKLLVEVYVKPQGQFKTMQYPPFANFQRSFLIDMSIISHLLRMSQLKIGALYLDSCGCNIAIRSGYQDYVTEYITKYAPYLQELKLRIVPYVKETYELTARSYQPRASGDNKVCLVTGKIAGYRHMGLEFFVTAGHLVRKVGDVVNIGGGIQAKCIAKEGIIELPLGTKYTADMAFLKAVGEENHDNFNKIEINGKIYIKRLWRGGKELLMPGTEVWMYNQDEEIKKAIIVRYMECDAEANLYKVFQVRPKAEEVEVKVAEEQKQEEEDEEQVPVQVQGQSFSVKGDSGACVFLPPDEDSNVVYVFGMVVSRGPNTGLTNVVDIRNVMPYMLKNTINSIYATGPDLCKDDDESIYKAIEFVIPVAVPGNVNMGQVLSGQTMPEGYACANIGASVSNRESGFGSASGYRS